MPSATRPEAVDPPAASRRSSRWVTMLAVPPLLIVLFVVGLPWIVSNTSILNGLLKSGLAGHEIEASIGQARLGWMTPASLYDIQLRDEQDRWSLDADRASTELTLLQLLLSRGDLGQFSIKGPTLVVNADKPWPEMPQEEEPPAEEGEMEGLERLRVLIEDGRVLVRTATGDEPDEFVRGANLVIDYERNQDKRSVVIQRGKPIERVELTKEMCDLGLKYVLPILADVTWVRGALSVELDRCEIQLGDPQGTRVDGRLYIHSIESGLHEAWVSEVATAASLLGDMKMPESVRLADESVVRFKVSDGRVEHENLQFGLPEVSPDLVITTTGTVGFDQSLDLVATLPPFGDWMGDGVFGQAMRAGRLELAVAGTLEQPQTKLLGGEEILKALPIVGPMTKENVTDEDVQETLDDVGEVVDEAVDLLRNFRQQREERMKQREEEGIERRRPFQRLRERRRARQTPR